MVENLIKLDKIKKSLNISINVDDEKIFNKMNSGYYLSPDISFVFNAKGNIVSVYEILNAKSILKETKSYQTQILRDKLPSMPNNSFIFATDIGGDYFVFNADTGLVYYCGEINFYHFSELSMPLSELINCLSENDEDDECVIFKFTDNEICSLNHINSPILADFLSIVKYGINHIHITYVYKNIKYCDTIDFIYGFDYLRTINNSVTTKFNFGKTSSDKELFIDLSNGDVIISDDIVISNYLDIFKIP